jgi:hypothetical protein
MCWFGGDEFLQFLFIVEGFISPVIKGSLVNTPVYGSSCFLSGLEIHHSICPLLVELLLRNLLPSM